ncbi:hypothetical protein WG66_005350 [Moniliophthora roreri]|nr:hypothetical protein WG66_005350 [Moniliophthora roreri]
MTPRIRYLPFDVIDHVLWFLLRSDPPPGISRRKWRIQQLDVLSLISRDWMLVSRGHFWDAFQFNTPNNFQELEELQHLCSSPFCTFPLSNLREVAFDVQAFMLESFLEWCSAGGTAKLFPRLERITLDGATVRFKPHVLGPTISTRIAQILSRHPHFQVIARIHMSNITFPSAQFFSEFISSFSVLEWLDCSQLTIQNPEYYDELSLPIVALQIQTLRIDSHTFFEMFYQRIELDGLRDLTFEDWNREHLAHRPFNLKRIGEMLAYTGVHLERLRLEVSGQSSGRHNPSLISDSVDISNKAPKLKSLYLSGHPEYLLPILSPRRPHARLSSVKMPSLPSNKSTLDTILSQSVPHLEELSFVFELPLSDSSEVKVMAELAQKMPWCSQRGCLFPTFNLSESAKGEKYQAMRLRKRKW